MTGMERRIEEKREQLAELCRQYHVRRLALFGSALRDDFDPQRSDLDFLVEFEPLPAGSYAKTYFGLLASLQRLFERRVDLVEAGAIRNPYFRQEIEARQETLYAT
jgi:predicted nucleotidyltransferase